jgi:type I restriction enzyme R subunit
LPVRDEHHTRLDLIDPMLQAAGWIVQDRSQLNLHAGRGVAVREFPLESVSFADYLLFVDQKAVGVVEAKAEGITLSAVAEQSSAYITSLPERIPHVALPLPFAYECNGHETFFRDIRDPDPRSRRVFAFHRPETLAEWAAEPLTLRARLQQLPPLNTTRLWSAQTEAITNLEHSFALSKPRALIQMATGSGKTFTAISSIYRLIKFAKVKRVLFLVDRSNLGRQALKEFQAYITPDDGRKFTELYNVQRLTTNKIDPVNQVVITTIQRLYSMLQGEEEFDSGTEEGSLFESSSPLLNAPPLPVVYNPAVPPETFDIIITDECHRSIYNLWRQVFDYFDSFVIGLTATPSKQTLGFFNQNLVMEYPHERAVADGVNVDGLVYRIRTRITTSGSKVEAGWFVDKRDKRTRRQTFEQLEDDLVYPPQVLDNEVVSESQIRTVIRAYRDHALPELFPNRTDVPKTLIFAKDDSHAEDIVRIVREEFGKGNDFCQKITYRVSHIDPEDLIASFRNSYNPRIAVSVDMIATGTDIRPLEVLLFMRLIRSRVLFEQMIGRGTRIISPTDLQAVTPGEITKDHYIIIDAVGIVEAEKVDTQTIDRKPSVAFPKLLEAVAMGVQDTDTLSTLAARLIRLETNFTSLDTSHIENSLSEYASQHPEENAPISLDDLVHTLLQAETVEQRAQAAKPIAGNPPLRELLADIHTRSQQIIDIVSIDTLLNAELDPQADSRALNLVNDFQQFIEAHKDEITALQLLYAKPYASRELTFAEIQELAQILQQPPHSWTTEKLWLAYAQLEKDRVHGAAERRVLTDLVSLVRHAVHLEDELVPFPQKVTARYAEWLQAQESTGKQFTPAQRWWLDRIAEHIGVNLHIGLQDFEVGEFFNKGGRLGAQRILGADLQPILKDLNEKLIT